MTDQELVTAALNGDQDAYTILYRRLVRQAKAILQFQFPSRWATDRAEKAHDGAVHALLTLNKYRGGPFKAWAKTVMMRHYGHEVRSMFGVGVETKRKRIPANKYYALDLPLSEGERNARDGALQLFDSTTSAEHGARLHEILGRIPYTYRRALELHYLQGLSHEEIGALAGVSRRTAARRVRQALETAQRVYGIDFSREL